MSDYFDLRKYVIGYGRLLNDLRFDILEEITGYILTSEAFDFSQLSGVLHCNYSENDFFEFSLSGALSTSYLETLTAEEAAELSAAIADVKFGHVLPPAAVMDALILGEPNTLLGEDYFLNTRAEAEANRLDQLPTEGNDILFGSSGDDTLYGLGGNDWIAASHGSDTAFGGDGDDFLQGNNQNDLVVGENGDDEVFAQAGNDYVWGQAGNDMLYGEVGNDWLFGEIGTDTLYGGLGEDRLYGQEEDDVLYGGDDADILIGGEGADTLYGGEGFDIAAYYIMTEGVSLDLSDRANDTGEAVGDVFDSIESFHLTLFDDVFTGDDGNNRAHGLAGNDVFYGGDGIDTFYGGEGDDEFYGGLGDDFIYAEDGADRVYINAGEGKDTLYFFDVSEDKIIISAGVTSFDELTISMNGLNTVVDFGSGSVVLRETDMAVVTADLFEFA